MIPGRILVTGGAGFVGANLCLALAERHPDAEVVALDSLKRRGSELNLPRLRAAGVEFVHGDVRERDDLLAIEPVEAIVECSAEPSVLAGMGSGADFVVQTNLLGAHNCFELARRDGAHVVFLSTSRVYPVAAQLELHLREEATRFALEASQPFAGASEHGIAEDFPLAGARTLYGATKLAAELLMTEYADAFGIRATIDRCGVIAGPWQMGKVDQGVFTHWLLAHYQRRPLTYIGYGGTGKQVRDVLHVDDVCDLVLEQLADPGGLGRRDGQRRRRRRGLAVAARDDRHLRRADRQRGADRAGRAGAAGRRAALRDRLPAAVRAHGLAAAARAADRARGHAELDRGQRARRARGARMTIAAERRRAVVGLGLLLLFGLALLLYLGRDTTFYFDEWDWVQQRREWTLDTLLEPHNEHLSVVPILFYKLLFATVGIDHYWPYRVLGLAMHALVVVGLFFYARRRVGDVLALAAAATILFLGKGWNDVLWPFQAGFMASTAAGVGRCWRSTAAAAAATCSPPCCSWSRSRPPRSGCRWRRRSGSRCSGARTAARAGGSWSRRSPCTRSGGPATAARASPRSTTSSPRPPMSWRRSRAPRARSSGWGRSGGGSSRCSARSCCWARCASAWG